MVARLRQQFLREVAARPVVDVTTLRMPKLPGMIAEDTQAAAELQVLFDPSCDWILCFPEGVGWL